MIPSFTFSPVSPYTPVNELLPLPKAPKRNKTNKRNRRTESIRILTNTPVRNDIQKEKNESYAKISPNRESF